jgi:hypothetical protein
MKIDKSVSLGESLDRTISRVVEGYAMNHLQSSDDRQRRSTDAYAEEFIEGLASRPEVKDYWIGFYERRKRELGHNAAD